ncbi:MAG: PAS domain-containing protein [Kiritimatiellia bacterium]|jgi:PAS domain-containing protein|nr:PAS domain-containing protein [Kiritimatiellia bacterium]MDP6848645.1 PAS domain-containing protein [Kiritimatiellia bacterium]
MMSDADESIVSEPGACSDGLAATVFEHSPDAIFVKNYDGRILEVNPAA